MLVHVQFLQGQTISKVEYKEKLKGFWLGSCIANWTGLKTEGQRNNKPYYTDEDWNTNQGNEWHGAYIDFVLDSEIWGADDDTDIEYIYQHALETYDTYLLTGEQIRSQWLEHISSEEENFLWVSNESAFNLMREENMIPPITSLPHLNENWEMIDAQLTTEIFGLLAPSNPDIALDISYLPIRTTAYSHSMYAAQFYVIMHSLASIVDQGLSRKDQILWLADSARTYIPEVSYIAKMYDWVRNEYINSTDIDDWESIRDGFHDYYIEGGADNYTYSAFYDCGSNFGFSIISLLFGEGDLKRTIQIGTLSGQDSDNPTATWGGLLGFMYGFEGIQEHFDKYDFSELYDISRTRLNFGEELDTFSAMADRLLPLIDKVILERMKGTATQANWIINFQTSNNYYISSVNGNDSGDGSKNNPWNSLDNIDGYAFLPGDSVLFERGSQWIGTFEITASGSLYSPIVFSSYGEGEKPAISNPDVSSNKGNAIRISANHILIDDFYIYDCGTSDPRTVAGIASFNRVNHNITVQNSEFRGCRVAVRLYAHDVLVTNNHMYSPGGGINKWWGPMAIVGAGYSGEISYNNIEGFLAPNSYGFDGGAIEIDDEGIHTNWKIHHNISLGNQGFIETYDDSECDNCTWGNFEIYYNYSDDYQWFLDGPIGNNPIIENNTILRVLPANTDFNWGISLHHTIPQGSVRNNIFVLANGVKAFEWEDPGNSTSDNIYFSVDGSLDNPKGYVLGNNEIITDPLFVNFAERDIHLLQGSPAIDMGGPSQYSLDLDGNSIPFGNREDIGALESKFFAVVAQFEITAINHLTIKLDGILSLAEDKQSIISTPGIFGDDTEGSGSSVSHTYAEPGTYDVTLSVTSSTGESASMNKSVTVNKPPDYIKDIWRSYDAQSQDEGPQASVSDGITSAALQYYESTDNNGVELGELLETYTPGEHPEVFNHLDNYWGEYPYVGKSTVAQGADIGENKGRVPGVLDLQMHPPESEHLIVCSFEAPFSGNYTVTDLGIRRVYNDDSGTELKLFGPDKELITTISGTSRSWKYDVKTFQLKNVAKGDMIYFAVDNVDGFTYDAVEISWKIKFEGLRTGFNNSNEKQGVQVFPNPSSGLIHLNFTTESLSEDSILRINDITGRQIAAFILTEVDVTIDLSQYPSGIYIINYGEIYKRIIIS